MSSKTKQTVDYLNEDKPIFGQEWHCVSFIEKDGVKVYMIRGCFPTYDAANNHAKELQKTDTYVNIFVGESFKWCNFNPDPDTIPNNEYANEDQNLLMKKQEETMSKMNEIVGKYKKEIDANDIEYNKRKTEDIKNAAKQYGKTPEVKTSEVSEVKTSDIQKPQTQLKSHKSENARARLRRNLDKKKASENKVNDDLQIREQLIKAEEDKLKKIEEIRNTDASKLNSLNENLTKIKSYMKNQN